MLENIASVLLLIVYGAVLLLILVYSLVQLHLTLLQIRFYSRKTVPQHHAVSPDWPFVTVQLPIYNERYVVERLIDQTALLDYPNGHWKIQVLDDSTDETTGLIANKVAYWAAKGVAIEHVRRGDRTGFKAGALAFGLANCPDGLVAILDADFLPPPDFLLNTVHYFEDSKVGAVQTRWGHINASYSILSGLQAFGLDAHFNVEQVGRSEGKYFINFNGTAGVWRKQCIEAVGGWQADTLTEDLDLSYRAQLKGWAIRYAPEITVPAELPVTMPAIKSQQYRWNKGGAETARKLLGSVVRAKIPFSVRMHGVAHLLNSSIFLLVFLCSVLSVPMLYVKKNLPSYSFLFNLSSLFLLSLVSLLAFYWRGNYKTVGPYQFLPRLLMFLSVSMGLSLHNALAVIEGYLGRKTPFVRTPKYNITNPSEKPISIYTSKGVPRMVWAEAFLCLYFLFGIWLGWMFHDFGLWPFHLMLVLGYGTIVVYSIAHR